jgi:tetratricopeptide (TPR) repeat protein
MAVLGAACVGGCGVMKNSAEYLISGNEFFKVGDYSHAEKDYREALKRSATPVERATALNNLGVVLNEEGQYGDAVEVFKEGLTIDPKNVIATYAMAQALVRLKRYDEAIEMARKAIELNPDEAGGHRALADAAFAKGDYQTASDEYRYLTQADSDDDEAHQNLAKAQAANGDTEGAMLENQKAIEINPDNAVAITQQAELLFQKGDKAAALTQATNALDKDPQLTPAKDLIKRLQNEGADVTPANN